MDNEVSKADLKILLSREIKVNNNGGTKNAYKFKLEVIENSTNIDNNTSNVTINLYAAHNLSNTGGFKQYKTPKAILNIDDSEKANVTVSQIYGTTYNVIATWTGDVLHTSDGNKTIKVKTSFTPGTSIDYLPISCTIEENVILTYIPRTSTFTANDAEIEGICNIKIDAKSSSFTHTLLYSFGSLSGTIPDLNWTIPTSFYSQIPNSPSWICTITCITYLNGNEIGRATKNITIKCNEDKCKPNISGTIKDVNQATITLSGNENKLIKYKSTARITPDVTAKNGATIKSITLDGTLITGDKDILEVSKNTFNLTCIDSRNFSNSYQINADMIDYIPLTCNANFKRKTQTSGEIDLNYSGNYFNNSFGTTDNTLTLNWKYRVKGSTEWVDGGELTPTFNENGTYNGSIVCGDTFDYQKVYEFIVYFKDKLVDTNTGSIIITKGIPNFAIFKNCIKLNGVKIH